MSKYRKDQRALLVRHEEQYGLHRIVATVVFETDDGLRSAVFDTFDPLTELTDLEVRAHLSGDTVGAYGFTVAYAPHSVELAQALTIVRMLRRVEKKLDAARARFGYPVDFHGYLTQVAFALGIARFIIAPPDGGRFPNGQRYRPTDAAGLQLWIADQVKQYSRAPQPAED